MQNERPPRPLRLDEIPTQPWKNGNGTTQEVAAESHWRVSLASVTTEGLFSSFPGVTRHSMVVTGTSLILCSPTGILRLNSFEPTTYDGGAEWVAVLPEGGVSVLNVMVSADHVLAEVVAGSSFRVCAQATAKFFLLAFGTGAVWKSANENQTLIRAGEYLEWNGLSHGMVRINASEIGRGCLVLVKLHLIH